MVHDQAPDAGPSRFWVSIPADELVFEVSARLDTIESVSLWILAMTREEADWHWSHSSPLRRGIGLPWDGMQIEEGLPLDRTPAISRALQRCMEGVSRYAFAPSTEDAISRCIRLSFKKPHRITIEDDITTFMLRGYPVALAVRLAEVWIREAWIRGLPLIRLVHGFEEIDGPDDVALRPSGRVFGQNTIKVQVRTALAERSFAEVASGGHDFDVPGHVTVALRPNPEPLGTPWTTPPSDVALNMWELRGTMNA